MSPLDALVRRSVVRISAPTDGYDAHTAPIWGSGFFVAPTWVLTCAHVVGKGGDAVLEGQRSLGITWKSGDGKQCTAEGSVRLVSLPDPAAGPYPTWPAPDLALVYVPGATDVECVWLGDRSDIGRTAIGMGGWSLETGPLTYRHCVGEISGMDGAFLLLAGEAPVEGTSGGPVVDLKRGGVIGVCKARKPDDPRAGLAVPITQLREMHDLRTASGGPAGRLLHDIAKAHDRYHFKRREQLTANPTWTDLHNDLHHGLYTEPLAREEAFDPNRRTELYGRLAGLAPPATPGEVLDLVDAVRRDMRERSYHMALDHVPRTWRDGAGLLYTPDGRRELASVMLYVARVAVAVGRRGHAPDAAPLEELRDWLLDSVRPLRDIRQEVKDHLDGVAYGAAEQQARPRAAVRAEIFPAPYGGLYTWQVKLAFANGDCTPMGGSDEGVARGGLRETLRKPIGDALGLSDTGTHLAPIEFSLPPDLLDMPVDTWQFAPPGAPEGVLDPDGRPLAQGRVVVVRAQSRPTAQGATDAWSRRWAGVEQGPLTAVALRAEVPDPGHNSPSREGWEATYDRLAHAPTSAVPIFCGPVAAGDGATAMDAAIQAGYPIAMWRTAPSGHTDCAEFHESAEGFIKAARFAGGLRAPLSDLRFRAADPDWSDPDARWGRSIALLYDPPDPQDSAWTQVHEPYPTRGTPA